MSTRTIKPTESELEILQVLWVKNQASVREVHEELLKSKDAGYTTTLKLMQIMAEKGLVSRDESTFAHVYHARIPREQTQRNLIADLLERAFEGSTSRLVLRALAAKKATPEELAEIRRILKRHERGDA